MITYYNIWKTNNTPKPPVKDGRKGNNPRIAKNPEQFGHKFEKPMPQKRNKDDL